MSYYYKHEFNFTTHSIQRIRQRLNLSDEEEFKLKEKILKMIEKSTENFETSVHIYIKTPKKDIFFVIRKAGKVMITATPISPARQLWLLENE